MTLTCLGSTYIAAVPQLQPGVVVAMATVPGATSYTIDFYSGGVIKQTSTFFNTNYGFCGVAPGTYTIGGHANAPCGSTPEVYWSTPFVVN